MCVAIPASNMKFEFLERRLRQRPAICAPFMAKDDPKVLHLITNGSVRDFPFDDLPAEEAADRRVGGASFERANQPRRV